MKFVELLWRCRVAGAERDVVTVVGDVEVLLKKIARINKLKPSEILEVEVLSSSCIITDDKAGFP
jgi:hypothetical protein